VAHRAIEARRCRGSGQLAKVMGASRGRFKESCPCRSVEHGAFLLAAHRYQSLHVAHPRHDRFPLCLRHCAVVVVVAGGLVVVVVAGGLVVVVVAGGFVVVDVAGGFVVVVVPAGFVVVVVVLLGVPEQLVSAPLFSPLR
jgi:hypothetical protein